jgi:hypothetical protein
VAVGSDKATGGDNQQETCGNQTVGILRDCTPSGALPKASKRQSDLHGDMQSQAEMTWPPCAYGARE